MVIRFFYAAQGGERVGGGSTFFVNLNEYSKINERLNGARNRVSSTKRVSCLRSPRGLAAAHPLEKLENAARRRIAALTSRSGASSLTCSLFHIPARVVWVLMGVSKAPIYMQEGKRRGRRCRRPIYTIGRRQNGRPDRQTFALVTGGFGRYLSNRPFFQRMHARLSDA